jgi:uncharacterized protein (TIGR02611 family)
VLRRIAEQRERLIHAQAARYLDPGEKIRHWVRARQVGGRADGFVFLTDARCVVHWTGRSDGSPGDFRWESISGWGISQDQNGGPILAIRSDDAECYVQLRANTSAMADDVTSFVRNFAEAAPWPREQISAPDHLGPFEATTAPTITQEKKSITDLSKRILVTVLGVALIIGAVVIIPLPGPWSLLVSIAGLAVLASEYDWARDALDWTKQKYQQAMKKVKARRQST